MGQNISSAVMAQRHEPHDSLDDFPTPPWAARALCEHVIAEHVGGTCFEPACGRGYLVKGLKDYFATVLTSDIHDYVGNPVSDFLFPGDLPSVGWVITNPPFRLAEQFAIRTFDCAAVGVALFVRTQFLEGIGRHDRLFKPHPPSIIAQFSERVPIIRGRVDEDASSATSYCWVVWLMDDPAPYYHGPIFKWIPPCRQDLERAGDYDTAP